MRDVTVAGGGILTPLGDLPTTWQRLLAVESGVVRRKAGGLPVCPLAMIGELPGALGSDARQQALFDYLQARLRQYLPPQKDGTGLFVATTKGAVDELTTEKESPQGQIWQVGEDIGLRLGLQAEPVVSAACASGLIAVIEGAMRIASGELEQAVIIGYDLLSEFVIGGFASLRSVSMDMPRPFDKQRDGLALGEGAGWLVLTAQQGEVSLLGWGIGCDAAHITAPSREGTGLQAVIRQLAGQAAEEIPLSVGGIIGHGTATVYNDAMELSVFDRLVRKGTPLCSVKGALGHSLAASGIIEVLLAIEGLEQGVLPPTVGLRCVEKSCCRISGSEPLPLVTNTVLTTNSGFGGINAGLLLGLKSEAAGSCNTISAACHKLSPI